MSELRDVLAEIHGANIAEQLDNLIAEWPTWDWPPSLNEFQREVALYESLQKQVRFTGDPQIVGSFDRWPRHNLFRILPRAERQRIYRKAFA